jgi:hypothetical protein
LDHSHDALEAVIRARILVGPRGIEREAEDLALVQVAAVEGTRARDDIVSIGIDVLPANDRTGGHADRRRAEGVIVDVYRRCRR